MVPPANNLQDEHSSPARFILLLSLGAGEFYRKSFDEVLGSIINFNKDPEICADEGICSIEMSLMSHPRKFICESKIASAKA